VTEKPARASCALRLRLSLDAWFECLDHRVPSAPIDTLLRARDSQTLAELVDHDSPQVREHEDQEHVAGAAIKHGALSVAVVDREANRARAARANNAAVSRIED